MVNRTMSTSTKTSAAKANEITTRSRQWAVRFGIRRAGPAQRAACQVIVTATLQDLEAGAGQAITAGGSLMPMRDFIRLASHAHHYLLIYDKHTREPLYLGRHQAPCLAGPADRVARA
jgi:hypothetical protein